MSDPYTVLGLPPDSDDDTIRRRYLELVRRFPPEHHPEKFRPSAPPTRACAI
jgi:curved DNA-binding protein CbpA